MALAYSQFGSDDIALYSAYLATFHDVKASDFVAGWYRVFDCHVGRVPSFGDGQQRMLLDATVDDRGVLAGGEGGSRSECGGSGSASDCGGSEGQGGRSEGEDRPTDQTKSGGDGSGGCASGRNGGECWRRCCAKVGGADAGSGCSGQSTARKLGAVEVESVDAKTLRNRQWRAARKARKLERQGAGEDWRVRGATRAFPEAVDESWVARKNAENKLKEMRALRQIELLQARDVEDEKKRQRARMLEQTERSKVNVERAYMTLRATGNVAGLSAGGSAETLVSGASVEGVPGLSPGSGSISPDSSVSLSEVREIQKKNLDLEKEVADLRKEIRRKAQFEALSCGREVVFTVHEGANSYAVAPSVAEQLREMDNNGEITHYVDNEFLGGVVVQRDLNVLYDAD